MSADNTSNEYQPRPTSTSNSDTEQFLALLSSSYPNGGGTGASAGAGQHAAQPDAGLDRTAVLTPQQAGGSTAGTPINPLVAAREATEAGRVAGATSPTGAAAGDAAKGVPPMPRPNDSDLFPIAEQAKSKEIDISFNERRHAGRIVARVLIILTVIVVVAVGALLFMQHHVRTQVDAGISSAWSSISTADEVITPMSEAMYNEIANGVVDSDVSDQLVQSQTASNALNDAQSAVAFGALQNALMSSTQKDAVSAVNSSIEGRRNIISVARTLLVNDNAASKAVTDVNNALSSISQALDQYSFTAGERENNANGVEVDLWNVVNADNIAIGHINDATTSIESAKSEYSSADYSVISTYLTDALSSYNLQVQYDTAVANGDTDTADSLSDQLGASIDLMFSDGTLLPADGTVLVSSAYAAEAAKSATSYNAAVSMIEKGDAAVASYLRDNGTSASTSSFSANTVDASAKADSAAKAGSASADAAASVVADAATGEVGAATQATTEAGGVAADGAAQQEATGTTEQATGADEQTAAEPQDTTTEAAAA